METSIVSIPAHPAAVQIAKQFNIDLPAEPVDAPSGQPESGHLEAADAAITRAKAAILASNKTLLRRK